MSREGSTKSLQSIFICHIPPCLLVGYWRETGESAVVFVVKYCFEYFVFHDKLISVCANFRRQKLAVAANVSVINHVEFKDNSNGFPSDHISSRNANNTIECE